MQILSVNNENFMHTPTTFFKLILTFKYKSTIVNLNATICDANNVSETNTTRRIGYMLVKKTFLLALVHSTLVDTIFDTSLTILVMVPVDAGFSWGLAPISLIRSTLVLHLTLGSNFQ